MHHLENIEDEENQKVWQSFRNGDLSHQKSDIPGTAIGRDPTGEQENKKIKSRGGIQGITRIKTVEQCFFGCPALASNLNDQMFNLGDQITKNPT